MSSAKIIGLTALSAVLSTLALGCFPKADGDRLVREAADREARLAALEAGISEQRETLTASLGEAQTKMLELETLLERATQVVTRNSADLGTEVAELREELQSIRGELAEVQQEVTRTQTRMTEQQRLIGERLTAVARRAGIDMPVDPSAIPADQAEHLAAANAALERDDHSTARALFRAYVEQYADDENADDALYAIGRSYLAQGRPRSALGEFRRVLSTYPRGDAVDRTLFDMAEAFYRLHACTDARSALEALLQAHRNSSLADQARQKLRDIRRAPRGYCTS